MESSPELIAELVTHTTLYRPRESGVKPRTTIFVEEGTDEDGTPTMHLMSRSAPHRGPFPNVRLPWWVGGGGGGGGQGKKRRGGGDRLCRRE